jgi:SHS2 domain-containing protein
MKYRYLDHTSDLGMEIFGKTLSELFVNAAFAMFDNITDLRKVVRNEQREVRLTADKLEDLFLDWLRELLFLFATEFFIPKKVIIKKLTRGRIEAELRGERFDPKRHRIKIEIKTPTYHMFAIEKSKAGYKATVIFDV